MSLRQASCPCAPPVIFGGVGQAPQVEALGARCGHPEVATPAVWPTSTSRSCWTSPAWRIFVLDEADRMLDMGFIHDVKKILEVAAPESRLSSSLPPCPPGSPIWWSSSFDPAGWRWIGVLPGGGHRTVRLFCG